MTPTAHKKLFLSNLDRETTICARCGYCAGVCCTHRELGWESTSPRGWLTMLRMLDLSAGLPAQLPAAFVERLYNCTLCGKCGQVCPAHIDLRRLWLMLREEIVRRGQGPAFVGRLREVVERERNVFAMPNEERAFWVELMPDAPDDLYQRAEAEVLYYVGCVSSFSPAAQDIPRALARVLELAGISFAILGGEEWCCGFPLLAAGMRDEAAALIAHNVARLRALGARTVVFNCPSCFHMWQREYGLADVELLHETQLLARLIDQGRLAPGVLPAAVSYHDPCDLGRNSGVYDEPRAVLGAIPGLRLRELPSNRAEAPCCGGGGDFEMLGPAIAQRIAGHLIGEAGRTGAERLVVACPQCKRSALSGVEAVASPLKVLDLAELVLESLGQASDEPH